MADLRVPSPLLPALTRLAAVPNDTFDVIASAFDSFPGGTRDQLVDELVERAGMPRRELSEIVFLAISVDELQASEGWEQDDAVETLAAAERFPGKTKAERRALAARVVRLLGHRGVSVAAKAAEAALANERTFHSARVFTDLRTVTTNEEDRPAMAIVLHTLDLSFHTAPDGRVQSIYMTLDDLDLDALTEALDVARRRGLELRPWLRPAGISIARPFGSEARGGGEGRADAQNSGGGNERTG